jgi:hypothetical protein
MAAAVVPSLEAGEITDQAVSELRQSALRSRFWYTRFGDWLLKKFWMSRLGLWFTRKFGDASAEELHGYAFWGPVTLAIAVTEILGVTSKSFRNAAVRKWRAGDLIYVADRTRRLAGVGTTTSAPTTDSLGVMLVVDVNQMTRTCEQCFATGRL